MLATGRVTAAEEEEEEERCCRKALHSATQAFEFQTRAESSRRASGEGPSVQLRRGESFRGLHPASGITAGGRKPRSLECERAKPNQWETSDCACIEQALPARTVHAKSFHSRANSAIQIVVPVGREATIPTGPCTECGACSPGVGGRRVCGECVEAAIEELGSVLAFARRIHSGAGEGPGAVYC